MFNLNIQIPRKQNFLWNTKDLLFKLKSIESLASVFFLHTSKIFIGERLFRRRKFPVGTDGNFLRSFRSNNRRHHCKTAFSPNNEISYKEPESTLALKPRTDITRSPKQGYQWPHKKDSCPTKNFFKKRRQKACKGLSTHSEVCTIEF